MVGPWEKVLTHFRITLKKLTKTILSIECEVEIK